MKRTVEVPAYERSSGNVFRDLGFPHPDEALLKADLVVRICEIVEHAELRQVDVAQSLGISQPKVSLLLRGRVEGFSVGRLMLLISRLGYDVDVVIRPHQARGRPTKLRVRATTSVRRAG